MVQPTGDFKEYLPYITLGAPDPFIGVGGFIDVETTGLSPSLDEVIELAIILFAFNRKTGQITGIIEDYTGLREPSIPVSQGAFGVHGITNTDLQGKSLDDCKILKMIEEAEFLVAHNANFDKAFVCKIYRQAAAKPWLCTMKGINWYRKGHRLRNLQYLLKAHGINGLTAHRAGSDVNGALKLLTRTGPDGKSYFAELLESKNKAV